MDKKLLDYDPLTGLMTWHSYDDQTDETTISYTGDSTPIIELNKQRQNDDELTKQGIKQEMWLYASIPAMVQVEWLLKYGVDIYNKEHGPRMSALLEDPEYKYLKTTTKHHRIK